MKFYYFSESEFEYTAVIWAESKKQALEKYGEEVYVKIAKEENKPSKIDIDQVFEMMVDGGFDGDKEHMAIGQIGRLHEIITSKEPIVVLHNCG